MDKLDGAWEERGVIGMRVEIDGKRLTVLWRGGAVLETRFSEKDGVLTLKNTGLRYNGAASDYARITAMTYADGVLTVEEEFPITGKSVTALTRTGNSRYGSCVRDDTALPSLAGAWERDGSTLVIDGDTLTLDGRSVKGCLLRSPDGALTLADADPAKDGLFYFSRLAVAGDALVGTELVLDAGTVQVIFRRKV